MNYPKTDSRKINVDAIKDYHQLPTIVKAYLAVITSTKENSDLITTLTTGVVPDSIEVMFDDMDGDSHSQRVINFPWMKEEGKFIPTIDYWSMWRGLNQYRKDCGQEGLSWNGTDHNLRVGQNTHPRLNHLFSQPLQSGSHLTVNQRMVGETITTTLMVLGEVSRSSAPYNNVLGVIRRSDAPCFPTGTLVEMVFPGLRTAASWGSLQYDTWEQKE